MTATVMPVSVRLPPETKRHLVQRAREANISLSEIIRQMIETELQGGVWVAYYPAHLSASLAVPFSTEVEALRWALANGGGLMQVKRVPFGSDIYDETGE